jgi:plasmid stabilization system protein ParE/DNA-binding transcriptional ArsR family regulator
MTERNKPIAQPRGPSDLAQRVAALEAAVRSLAVPAATAPRARSEVRGEGDFFVLDGLQARAGERGAVVYGGVLHQADGTQVRWQMGRLQDDLMALAWGEQAAALAALGHGVRLQLLQALMAGAQSVQQLVGLPGMGTTGQLYHHLRELEAAGWVHSVQRGSYAVPAERKVPLMAIVTALLG